MVEVEVDGGGVAFRWSDLDGGGIGGEGFCKKLELDGGTDESATAVIGTEIIWLARRRKGFEDAVFAENLNVKIFPKVIGTQDEADGRTGSRSCRARNVGRIGIRQKDLNDDFDGLSLAAVIESGLLSAVAGRVLAGLLDEKSERSEEGDGGDVRTGFRRRKEFCVFVQKARKGFIAALAEEVRLADSLVGQRRVKGEGRRADEESGEKTGNRAELGTRHGSPPCT